MGTGTSQGNSAALSVERHVKDIVLPELAPWQVWTCENGCGACRPVSADFEYSRETTPDGDLVESKTCKVYVSHCCRATLVLYDEKAETEVPWVGADLNLDGLVENVALD